MLSFSLLGAKFYQPSAPSSLNPFLGAVLKELLRYSAAAIVNHLQFSATKILKYNQKAAESIWDIQRKETSYEG